MAVSAPAMGSENKVTWCGGREEAGGRVGGQQRVGSTEMVCLKWLKGEEMCRRCEVHKSARCE